MGMDLTDERQFCFAACHTEAMCGQNRQQVTPGLTLQVFL